MFGCVTYARISKEERRKLDPKAKRCVVLGCGTTVKGSLACQTFEGGRERLVTIACNLWPLPECWQSQSDLSCGKLALKSRDDYETFNNVQIETWRKSCLPIFQMPLSAKRSIHELSSASLISSSSFLVSSLSFYNFSFSFLKHRHGRQGKASSWSTSSPAEGWHTSSCNSGTKL